MFYRKIISYLIILSILCAFICFPGSAFAASPNASELISFGEIVTTLTDSSCWQWAYDDTKTYYGCTATSDGMHVMNVNTAGLFATGECKMCHLGVNQIVSYDYAKFQSDYADYVSSMPADNWSSAGTIKVTGKHSYAYYYNSNNYSTKVFCSHYTGSNTSSDVSSSLKLTFNSDGSFSAYPASTGGSFNYFGIYYYWTIECPIDGRYSRVSSPGYVIYRTGSGSYSDSTSTKDWSSISSGTATFYSAGSSFDVSVGSYEGNRCGCVIGTFYPPIYYVTPAAGTTTTNYYTNASRPTYNITYDLATVTQAGDYTVINNVYEDQTIINEGDNIFIDPDTGNEYEIEGWEYDYTNRRYTCNLVDGSLLEVTFGDAYVTVELNGEVEYYYYATEDESGDEVTGGDTDCTHDFALAEALEPTCTTGGYEVYVCKLCAATYKDTSFAIGHNYELVEAVDPTVTLDESTLVCPGCNATEDLSYELTGDETFTVTCGSCSEEWTVAGSVESGYDLYRCSNCGDEYKDYTGEGVIRDDAGYWSWLQTWLQNFKTWLGEKLDALASGSGSGSGTGDLDVEVDMGDDVDYNITYTDEETGEETNITIKDFIGKFAFIKDIWKIGQTLISVVSEDAAYAYEFDPTIGNEATTDTGGEVAAASVTEEADTLLSSGSGAPSIPLNLGAAQSVYGFNYGGEIEMLDLSWYTPYKETVDKLVGGFLWLFFMWKLFQRAPDIISGAGMDSYKQEDLSAGNKLSRRRVKTNWRSRP